VHMAVWSPVRIAAPSTNGYRWSATWVIDAGQSAAEKIS